MLIGIVLAAMIFAVVVTTTVGDKSANKNANAKERHSQMLDTDVKDSVTQEDAE